MNQQKLLERIAALVGGQDNIGAKNIGENKMFFRLKDQSLADIPAIKAIPEVKQCDLKNGQMQIRLLNEREEKMMASKYDMFARTIIENVGGKKNIEGLTHCITRLRFILKDESKANTSFLKELDGVITVMQAGGQYQVVVGDKVEEVFDVICDMVHINTEQPAADTGKKKGLLNSLMDTISGVMSPILMGLSAAGMIKGLLSLFTSLGWMSATSGTYGVLMAIGDGFFYFLPIILGYTAAKKFKCSEFTGLAIGAALLYPDMVNLTDTMEVMGSVFSGTVFEMSYYSKFLGIPVVLPATGYASSVIPIIIAVYAAAKFENSIKKKIPGLVRAFLTPVIVFAVMAPLTYLVIGPVTTVLCNVLSLFFSALYDIPVVGGVISGAIICGVWGVLVMFGLHWAGISLAISNMATVGFDYILGAAGVGPFLVMAQGLAICLRTKNKKVRELAVPGTISQICGVGEPIMYGVLIPLKKPFVISIVCSAIGGGIAGLLQIKTYIMGGLGFFSLPNFINPETGDMTDMYNLIICIAISAVITFIIQFVTYKDPVEVKE